MWSETQWEYIGNCEICGAACYSNGEEFRSTTDMDCRCWVKGFTSPMECEFLKIDEEEHLEGR